MRFLMIALVIAGLALFGGTPLLFGADANTNGLDDAYDTWASTFTNKAPEGDEDSDGASNLFEYVAGTAGNNGSDTPDPGMVTELNYGFLIAIYDEADTGAEEQESSQFDWLATFSSGPNYNDDNDDGTTPLVDYELYYPELVIDCDELGSPVTLKDAGGSGYGYETAVTLTADDGTDNLFGTSDDFWNAFNRSSYLRVSGSYGNPLVEPTVYDGPPLTQPNSGEYARGFIAFNGKKYQGGSIITDPDNVAAETVLPVTHTNPSALLRLWVHRSNNTPKVHIYKMPNTWEPHTLTQTEAFSADLSTLTPVATNQALPVNVPNVDVRQWVEFDVTQAVLDWSFAGANTPPAISAFIADASTIETGIPVTFTVTATDTESPLATLQYYYDFNMADAISLATAGTGVQAYTFGTPGTYYVGVYVADQHGGFAYSAVGPITVTAIVDTDSDGLSDTVETDTGVYVSALNTGTDPNLADTDGDGMEDLWEVTYAGIGFNPNAVNTGNFAAGADLDGDGLTNLEESILGTNPNLADTDGDLFTDAFEEAQAYDPLDNASHPTDADSDGLADAWELTFAASIALIDGPDTDNDGITDIDEFNLTYGVYTGHSGAWFGILVAVDPTDTDSDGDSYDDGWELDNGFNPADATSKPTGKSGSGGGGCLPGAAGLWLALGALYLLKRR